MNDRRMLDLVGGIYDAVTEPERWPHVLEAVGESFDAAVLVSRMTRGEMCVTMMNHRCSPLPADTYHRVFGLERSSPYTAALPTRALATPLTPEAVEGEDAFLSSELYREVLQPNGLRYLASAVLHREPGWLTYAELWRGDGQQPFTSDELERFGWLARHLGRAIAIQNSLAAARATGMLLTQVIDCFDRGAIICERDGRPRLINRLAREILDRDDGLSSFGGRLRASRADKSAELARLIRDCAATSAGEGAESGGVMPLPRRSGAQDYALIVSPLSTAMLAGIDDRALALVLIADPDRRVPTQQQLARLHGLTPAEAKVAARLLIADTPAEIAQALGISINTVRYHLRNLLAKTGTRRQAELVTHLRRAS